VNVVAVHGIFNLRAGKSSQQAADELAQLWRPRLQAGLAAAGLSDIEAPDLHVAYYADKVARPGAQDGSPALEDLSDDEQAVVAAWLAALEAPTPADLQGRATMPIRQMLDWVARRRRIDPAALFRLAVALAREAHRYLYVPECREAARTIVAEAIENHRPSILLAHSLGSVVAYEALHHTDLKVDCLVTLGSPLGLPGAIFDLLEPQPIDRLGNKPPGVGQWINIADVGDLVAVPRRLGDRFPVDQHAEVTISALDFHTMGSYLSSGHTLSALEPFLRYC
jgi:hypothetical protein